jgi:hypothetical protein
MVMKKRLPALRRWFSSLDHIFGNARLSDTDAELKQLSVDPRRSPQRVGDAHLADLWSLSVAGPFTTGSVQMTKAELVTTAAGIPDDVVGAESLLISKGSKLYDQ